MLTQAIHHPKNYTNAGEYTYPKDMLTQAISINPSVMLTKCIHYPKEYTNPKDIPPQGIHEPKNYTIPSVKTTHEMYQSKGCANPRDISSQ
jgi:hypothetical protein